MNGLKSVQNLFENEYVIIQAYLFLKASIVRCILCIIIHEQGRWLFEKY